MLTTLPYLVVSVNRKVVDHKIGSLRCHGAEPGIRQSEWRNWQMSPLLKDKDIRCLTFNANSSAQYYTWKTRTKRNFQPIQAPKERMNPSYWTTFPYSITKSHYTTTLMKNAEEKTRKAPTTPGHVTSYNCKIILPRNSQMAPADTKP